MNSEDEGGHPTIVYYLETSAVPDFDRCAIRIAPTTPGPFLDSDQVVVHEQRPERRIWGYVGFGEEGGHP